MNTENVDYHPIKYIGHLDRHKHIVLLYDNEKYAYWIISRYILNGLNNNESCIFFTSDDPKTVEERLSLEGIDVNLFKQKNSLSIYNIEKSYNDKLDILSTLKHIRKEATFGMKSPYRFVGRTITDTETKDGMTLGIALEKIGHEHFDEFECSQMCYYDISKIEQSLRPQWIANLLKNHHNVIYASEPDKAVAFDTTLLDEG
jgi:MEDS: MEthanogen/methylotroph, DcmR Sensory domain